MQDYEDDLQEDDDRDGEHNNDDDDDFDQFDAGLPYMESCQLHPIHSHPVHPGMRLE